MSTTCSNEAQGRNGLRAAVLEHRRLIDDSDRRTKMHPQARVEVVDLLLRHLMAAPANVLQNALDGEFDTFRHGVTFPPTDLAISLC